MRFVEICCCCQHLSFIIFVSSNKIGGEFFMDDFNCVQNPLHFNLWQQVLLVPSWCRDLNFLHSSLCQVHHLQKEQRTKLFMQQIIRLKKVCPKVYNNWWLKTVCRETKPSECIDMQFCHVCYPILILLMFHSILHTCST